MAQIFLLFMPMNQDSIQLISMHDSVSNAHTPPTPQIKKNQKVVGGVKIFFCGHASRMKVTLK